MDDDVECLIYSNECGIPEVSSKGDEIGGAAKLRTFKVDGAELHDWTRPHWECEAGIWRSSYPSGTEAMVQRQTERQIQGRGNLPAGILNRNPCGFVPDDLEAIDEMESGDGTASGKSHSKEVECTYGEPDAGPSRHHLD